MSQCQLKRAKPDKSHKTTTSQRKISETFSGKADHNRVERRASDMFKDKAETSQSISPRVHKNAVQKEVSDPSHTKPHSSQSYISETSHRAHNVEKKVPDTPHHRPRVPHREIPDTRQQKPEALEREVPVTSHKNKGIAHEEVVEHSQANTHMLQTEATDISSRSPYTPDRQSMDISQRKKYSFDPKVYTEKHKTEIDLEDHNFCVKHFSWKQFTFYYKGVSSDFATSKWPMSIEHFVVYRGFMVVALTSWFVLQDTLWTLPNYTKWFIYLGNWVSVLVYVYFVYSLVLLVTLNWKHKIVPLSKDDEFAKIVRQAEENVTRKHTSYVHENFNPLTVAGGPVPWFFKVQWFLISMTSQAAHVHNVFYWTTEHSNSALEGSSVHYIIDTVAMTMDIFMVSIPLRFAHVWHFLCLVTIYIMFSVIHWKAGGTNYHDFNFTIKALDYEDNPENAVFIIALVILFVAPCFQTLCITIAYARDFAFHLYVRSRITARTEEVKLRFQGAYQAHQEQKEVNKTMST